MLMTKCADYRAQAYAPDEGISVTMVEVTDSAHALEQSHLCGPTAALVQAEALAGVALLGSELTQPLETVTFRLGVEGPLGSVLVENAVDGGLRGYTQVKILEALDSAPELDIADAFGASADVQMIRSIPGTVLSSASLHIEPVTISSAVEAIYKQSFQRHVCVQTLAQAYDTYLDGARGVMAECLPDGKPEAFERISALFADQTVNECLESSASLASVCRTLGLEKCTYAEPKPLRFACRCSDERIQAMLGDLPDADLKELLAKGKPVDVYCHMCGKCYTVQLPFIESILKGRELHNHS